MQTANVFYRVARLCHLPSYLSWRAVFGDSGDAYRPCLKGFCRRKAEASHDLGT